MSKEIMNKFSLTNITSAASVKTVCNLFKSVETIMHYYLSTLRGLCLTVFTLKSFKSGTKINFVLLMSFIAIGHFLEYFVVHIYPCILVLGGKQP